MDDSDLITRFKEQGDRSAFEAIISKYESLVYRFGFRMCGQREDAEDVVQDTFISALKYLSDFRGEASLPTWLLKIASSACLKKRRSKRDQAKHHVSYDDVDNRHGAEAAAGQRGKAAPDAQVMEAEVRQMLQRALERIPSHYRVVMVLRDMEGRSGKETGEILDLTESAVKVRLHRARAMVFKEFKRLYDGDGQGTR